MKSAGLLPIFLLLICSELPAQAEKQVAFYRTYGYEKDGAWIIPRLTFVVYRRLPVTTKILPTQYEDKASLLGSRLRDFFVDHESKEAVTIAFDADPGRTSYALTDQSGEPVRTDGHGWAQGFVRLKSETAGELLKAQAQSGGWVAFSATSPNHQGKGRVQLLSAEGTSVVSDIDDTVKVTGIPQGWKVVLENTFLRDFVPAKGMLTMYHDWQKQGTPEKVTGFHYVSGGFWQLYSPVADFLFSPEVNFPEGSFAMRRLLHNPVKFLAGNGLKGTAPMEANDPDEERPAGELNEEPGTRGHKLARIREIMKDFPRRKFILVGDSGEKDPEVYRQIREEFPAQVERVIIREATNLRARTKGMELIHLDESGAELMPPEKPQP